MKVAVYARVSSEKQAENDLSISAQIKEMAKYAKRNNMTIVKEFIDEAESARSANRPAFQEMITQAKKKEKPFDAILVWKLSRFARNREDSIIYKSLLRKHGVSVISINEQVDDTPSGRLLEGIIEVIDEFYSLNLAQDTIRGLRENAMRGFCNGTIPIGYKAKKVMDGTNQRTKLEPDETYAPIIQRIFKMANESIGIKEIAKILNQDGILTQKGKPWGKTTISYILNNDVYIGTMVYGKNSRNPKNEEPIRIENNHPAIISKDLFFNVKESLMQRSSAITHPRRVASDYLLSGLIYCGKCGLKMIGSSAKSGQFFYYACQNYSKRGKHVCNMKMINRDEIEILVIEQIKSQILTEENIKELFDIIIDEMNEVKKASQERLASIEKQLDKTRNRLNKLYDTLETGKLDIDDLAPRIKDIKDQIDEFERQRREALEDIEKPGLLPIDLHTIAEYVSDLSDLLKKGTIAQRRSFIKSFVNRIDVDHPYVSIEYTIPLDTKKAEPQKCEVLPMGSQNSPGWTRTNDIVVNSHSLYRLSYRGI